MFGFSSFSETAFTSVTGYQHPVTRISLLRFKKRTSFISFTKRVSYLVLKERANYLNFTDKTR